MNEYYYKKERDNDKNGSNDEEGGVILSRDGRWFYDENIEDWRPIDELEEYLEENE